MKNYSGQTLKIYWLHARKYPWAIFFVVSGLLVYAVIDVYIPFLYRNFFNLLATGDLSTGRQLVSIITVVAAWWFVAWVGRRAFDFSYNLMVPRVISDLQNSSFAYLQDHSYNFFSNNFAGSLVRKVNRFAKSFEDIFRLFSENLGDVALHIVLILFVLFRLRWELGLGVLVWVIIYTIFSYRFSLYKLKFTLKRAELDSVTTGYLADTVTNNINLKLFATEKREHAGFSKLTEKLYHLRKFTWNLDAYIDSIQGLLMIGLEFGVFYIAIKYYVLGLVTLGDFALLQSYILMIIIRVWDVGRHVRRIYEALADADEMSIILETPHAVKDALGAKILKVQKAQVEFSKTSFAYKDGLSVLENFHLQIQPGERVALIGPSGGGKTTIIKLLLRFYNIDSGQILIDGQSIDQVTLHSLRRHVALVPQEPILFHRSLIENIRYARPEASKTEVVEAAKKAHAHEFISRLPKGYETFVGERGIKLSGGERQRVAIARAIIKDAPILVLDEATSSLDSESERYIQRALKNLMAGRTTIVIAHRLSTIMQMDRIVVIEQGKIKEQGKHAELVKVKKGLYQKLWEIQAGGFT